MGTAALTYRRWTVLDQALSADRSVSPDDIRRHFRAVSFTAPVEGARTFWHRLYDVDEAAVELSFSVGDVGGRSHYSDLRRFTAGTRAETPAEPVEPIAIGARRPS